MQPRRGHHIGGGEGGAGDQGVEEDGLGSRSHPLHGPHVAHRRTHQSSFGVRRLTCKSQQETPRFKELRSATRDLRNTRLQTQLAKAAAFPRRLRLWLEGRAFFGAPRFLNA
jgi:hypothetical protein